MTFIFSVAVMRPLPLTWTAQRYVVKLFWGPIEWKSRKQTTVTTSTTEAKLLAPSRAAQETYWWKILFNAVDFELDHDIHISCDNKPTVDSIKKKDIELKTKMKHVDIYNHWLRGLGKKHRAVESISNPQMD